jgi:hypothetical protein
MHKSAGLLEDVYATGKSGVLLALLASTAIGVGAGWTAEKISAPVEKDFDNARDSYSVGNLKAMVMSNANKLREERMRITNKKQKALRLV